MTLLALAALVIAFVATWVTVPSDRYAAVDPPASLFKRGLTGADDQLCINFEGKYPNLKCLRYVPTGVFVNTRKLEQRIRYVFGGAAAAVVLVGLAFGAGRRSRPAT